MKKASEIYKSDFYWTEYQPMLNEFGTILLQVDEETWQGNSWLIYQDKNKFGYLSFGWGSCSGCDALQACSTIEEVQELMDRLYNSITWYGSLDELKDKLLNKDWELCYEGQCEYFDLFLNQLKTLTTLQETQNKLLFQELCARMPYGVKLQHEIFYSCCNQVEEVYIDTLDWIKPNGTIGVKEVGFHLDIDEVKPCLFPISSLNEKQCEELYKIAKVEYADSTVLKTMLATSANLVNWCMQNHIDINGLIPMGLAIDATEKNIY